MGCRTKVAAWLIAGLLASGGVQAALIDRGGGLVYDDVLDITWLQDANYAKTSGYDDDGKMNWLVASNWAENLDFSGYNDWRLPKAIDIGPAGCDWGFAGTDCGFNVVASSSELAHLYYVDFQNLAAYGPLGDFQPAHGLQDDPAVMDDESLFVNLQEGIYLTSTVYAAFPPSQVWLFNLYAGSQDFNGQDSEYYAWAVRDGDVASSVPEPLSLALVSLGLAATAIRRKPHKETA